MPLVLRPHMTPTLELYYFPACPFCQMVIGMVKQLNLKIEYKDIYKDQENLNKLIQDTGKKTVPCLYIDGNPMFESRDIMQWLSDNQNQLEKN